MAASGMHAGLTSTGRAYADTALLRYAAAFEATGWKRVVALRPTTAAQLKGQRVWLRFARSHRKHALPATTLDGAGASLGMLGFFACPMGNCQRLLTHRRMGTLHSS